MQIYQGKSVFSGIAIGKIRVYKKNERQVKRVKVENPDAEMARFEEAKAKGIAQLGVLYEKACKEVGEANAAIFEVHQMMMEDDGYNESVENIIKSQGVNAEYAVATTGDNFAQMFSAMDDDYMRERAADVKDISERLISILNGDDTDASLNDEPAIIVADDLAPSETVQMDKDKVLSFVTVHGSLNSHTAILARTMAIPALVGTPLPLDESVDGKLGIVDGSDGTIYVDPDEETLAAMQKRRTEEEERKNCYLTLKGKENITLDGQKILLYANIGNIKDLAAVMQNDAGASACSEASLSILSRITIQQRRSSSVSTNRQQRRWRENASSSVPSISVPINSAIISRWKRGEPGTWLPCDPHLPDAAGDLQDTASRAVPRKRIWKNCHYVSNDHKCRRGSPDQSDCGGSKSFSR